MESLVTPHRSDMSVMLPSLTADFVPLNLFYFVDQEQRPVGQLELERLVLDLPRPHWSHPFTTSRYPDSRSTLKHEKYQAVWSCTQALLTADFSRSPRHLGANSVKAFPILQTQSSDLPT